MRGQIYADNAATTRLWPEVLEAMLPHLTTAYGNPSAPYGLGQSARGAVNDARQTLSRCLRCRPEEVYFTSGGSESDNWALKMAAEALQKAGKTHIVSTAFEHPAVLRTLDTLARHGWEVTLLPVYENGIVKAEDVAAAIRENTALVSVMLANNEIGTIQPVSQIGALCRERGVLFHTDAVQAAGQVPVDFEGMHIDLLSLSAHKFHGPKGAGALLIRRGLRLGSLIDGGAQESGRRAGTENTAGIVGMAAALALSCERMARTAPALAQKRDRLIEGLLRQMPRSRLNGDRSRRLPGNVHLCLEGIEGDRLVALLDRRGVCASSGAACASGTPGASHVLLALGLSSAAARGSLRLTLSDDTTDDEVDELLHIIPETAAFLRGMAP